MPPFHLSAVPSTTTPRRRPSRAAVREALQQELQGARQPGPEARPFLVARPRPAAGRVRRRLPAALTWGARPGGPAVARGRPRRQRQNSLLPSIQPMPSLAADV